MRNYNKIIVSFLILSFLVLNILGCGSSGGMNEESPEPAPTPEPVYNLTGTVYNTSGATFSGVYISVFSKIYSATTDSAGAFSLEVSKSIHTLLASRAGYRDTYQLTDLSGGIVVDLPVILQKSAIAAVNVLPTAESFLTSNSLNNSTASLRIPVQSSGSFTVGSDGGLKSVNIVLENLDLSDPLTVPMPSPDIMDKPVIGGKQAPSVLVSVQPALLKMSTPAVLTLPNPDNLDVTSVLWFDPENHEWKTIDAVSGTSIEISKGGVYGIFFDERRTASVRGTATPDAIVQVGDETVVVGPEGSFYINEFPFRPKDRSMSWPWRPQLRGRRFEASLISPWRSMPARRRTSIWGRRMSAPSPCARTVTALNPIMKDTAWSPQPSSTATTLLPSMPSWRSAQTAA